MTDERADSVATPEPQHSKRDDPRLSRLPRVVKWRRVKTASGWTHVPERLEHWELHRAQLDDGTVKEIILRCEQPYRGTENYEPAEPPEDV